MRYLKSFAACIALCFCCGAAFGSTRTIEFTNKEHEVNQPINDLHFVFNQDTKITANPFGNNRQTNPRIHNLWGMTVSQNGSVTVAFESAATDLTIADWWWTFGGNATSDGSQRGDTHHDTGGTKLSFVDAPATGNGALLININASSHIFMSTPGFTAAQTAAAFTLFLDGMTRDDGFALINQALLSNGAISFAGNLLGDPTTELSVRILQQDSTQQFVIPEPSTGQLLLLGAVTLLWFHRTKIRRRA